MPRHFPFRDQTPRGTWTVPVARRPATARSANIGMRRFATITRVSEMPADREYTGQQLCLDYGDVGHVPISGPLVRLALTTDGRCRSGLRVLDRSPITRLPIVVCDERKLARQTG